MKKDVKTEAKRAMLGKLSNSIKDSQYSSLGDELKNKKLSKVTVASDSPEGLKKGMSLAEKLLKAKFKGMDADEPSEEEEVCPICKGEGCEECEELEDEDEME